MNLGRWSLVIALIYAVLEDRAYDLRMRQGG